MTVDDRNSRICAHSLSNGTLCIICILCMLIICVRNVLVELFRHSSEWPCKTSVYFKWFVWISREKCRITKKLINRRGRHIVHIIKATCQYYAHWSFVREFYRTELRITKYVLHTYNPVNIKIIYYMGTPSKRYSSKSSTDDKSWLFIIWMVLVGMYAFYNNVVW